MPGHGPLLGYGIPRKVVSFHWIGGEVDAFAEHRAIGFQSRAAADEEAAAEDIVQAVEGGAVVEYTRRVGAAVEVFGEGAFAGWRGVEEEELGFCVEDGDAEAACCVEMVAGVGGWEVG